MHSKDLEDVDMALLMTGCAYLRATLITNVIFRCIFFKNQFLMLYFFSFMICVISSGAKNAPSQIVRKLNWYYTCVQLTNYLVNIKEWVTGEN